MTDDNTAPDPSGSPAPAAAASPEASDATAPGNPANKAFWLGMGVGSAALIAALMYSRRPRRKK
ncbi:MAG: hypothetical protein J0I80_05120 [Sphingomonas sp.]|nr:hypothetical protein [Sphingomonas sp.]